MRRQFVAYTSKAHGRIQIFLTLERFENYSTPASMYLKDIIQNRELAQKLTDYIINL